MGGSWGRLPIVAPSRSIERDWRFESLPTINDSDSLLAHGCGRSYGDVCINSDASQLGTGRLNRFIRFDTERGILNCEAGLTLNEILQVIVPRGWFLPVLPGTRFVTIGGAVANDVHGKNHHHAGSFGCHVRALTLLRSDTTRPSCSATENAALFAATIGGLGLTGLITSVEISLIPISSDEMVFEDIPFGSVAEFAQLSRESADWEYTVSWVDTCARKGQVGRGIFSRARHASDGEKLTAGASNPKLIVPFAPPFSLVNKWTVDVVSRLYYAKGSRGKGLQRAHYQPFFFPLDAIAHWNRSYGRNGFYQYQCVLPHEEAEASVEALLHAIRDSGQASFLAVLKMFGDKQSPGLLSFPRPGFTLAVDFPNRDDQTLRLFDSLDEIVVAANGALYPAKDARMSPALFTVGYPEQEAFKQSIDSGFSSAFWRRVSA